MILVQRLLQIQSLHGYLPDNELDELAKQSGAPLYRLQEIASFFPHFRQEWAPPPYVEIKVCRDIRLMPAFESLHGPKRRPRRDRENVPLSRGNQLHDVSSRARPLC